ncbi:peptidoglycan-binding protein [Clostridiaceae bacterium M8S5]|nr:peptidoglycan-binding protein [Clostridiaceae bacterium M8S5]
MKKTNRKMIALLFILVMTMALSSITAFAAPSWPTLREGKKGVNVRTLQCLLNFHKCYTGVDGEFGTGTRSAVKKFQSKVRLTADGIFGSKTKEYVKDFQARYNLDVDGYVGPETWLNLIGRLN